MASADTADAARQRGLDVSATATEHSLAGLVEATAEALRSRC
jgi:uroporphyrinogen-III synthase